MDGTTALLEYIFSQSDKTILTLLSNASTCRTYIRLLHPIAQQFFFRLLPLQNGCPYDIIERWAKYEYSQIYITQLIHSRLVNSIQDLRTNSFRLEINENVRKILLNNYQSSELSIDFKSKVIKGGVEENELDDWSLKCLYSIIEFMLKIKDKIDSSVNQILAESGLITFDGELTKLGNKFLLLSPKVQIWRIIKYYLEKSNIIESLTFLLILGSLQFGSGYPISDLNNIQKQLIKPFNILGLVYIKNNYFYPTKSVLNFFGKSNLFSTQGWLLMDTNYKITAYPTNIVQSELLKRFTKVTYQMTGFISCFVSPDSFRTALDKGTDLDDIVSFLQNNLIQNIGGGIIPPTIRKQFQVWKDQRERFISFHNCILRRYDTFQNAEIAASIARDNFNGLIKGPIQRDTGSYYIVTKKEIEEQFSLVLNQYYY